MVDLINAKSNKEIASSLIKFSLPLILSSILQQLYGWIDALIVGNVAGEISLAAIGSTTAFTGFYLMIIFGFATGLSILFAQNYGSGRHDANKKLLATYTMLFLVVFTAITILSIVFARQFLELLNTTPETIDLAESYLKIVLIGVPFMALYDVHSAALRGTGDSKTPFWSIIISSVVNIILDIIFVIWFRWGVEGAAFATIIAQIVMTVYLVIYGQKKRPLLKLNSIIKLLDKGALKEGMHFGIPPMIQSGVTGSGNLVLQNFMNGFGTPTVAAITTAYRIDSIIFQPIINLASAISTVVAQNYGAGYKKKTIKVFAVGTVIMAITSIIISLILMIWGGNLVAMFGVEAEATAIGRDFFIRLGAFYLVFGLASATRGYLEGMGDLTYSSIVTIVALLIRIAGSYLFMDLWDNMVIAYAEGISWCFLLLFYLVRAKYKKFPDQIAVK